MAASLLARLALGAVVGAVTASAGKQSPCEVAGGGSCPAVAARPVLSQDSMLLQMRQNSSSVQLQRGTEARDEPVLGYPKSGDVKAQGLWCSVSQPPRDWSLKYCPFDAVSHKTRVKVLTYNLFWWNLFNQNGGADRSAGKLIARSAGAEGYDLMGFQECDDRKRVLADARAEGLQGDWEALDGGHAIALMYRKDRFTLLETGAEDVGEDSHDQYYGKRSAVWVRLRHADGTTVFYINHHGPLPVSWGGGCTGSATTYNLLRVIASHAHKGDGIILTGDFNAEPESSRIQEMSQRMHRVYSGTSMGGVDHIFSNCPGGAETANLGKGGGLSGSDHDALSVVFHF